MLIFGTGFRTNNTTLLRTSNKAPFDPQVLRVTKLLDSSYMLRDLRREILLSLNNNQQAIRLFWRQLTASITATIILYCLCLVSYSKYYFFLLSNKYDFGTCLSRFKMKIKSMVDIITKYKIGLPHTIPISELMMCSFIVSWVAFTHNFDTYSRQWSAIFQQRKCALSVYFTLHIPIYLISFRLRTTKIILLSLSQASFQGMYGTR